MTAPQWARAVVLLRTRRAVLSEQHREFIKTSHSCEVLILHRSLSLTVLALAVVPKQTVTDACVTLLNMLEKCVRFRKILFFILLVHL